MIYTYEDYLKMSKIIDVETCLKIHKMMAEEIGTDEEAIELYGEIVEKSAEYTLYRAYWTIKDREWKMDNDPARSAKHDSIIIKFNQLSRYLKMQGKDAKWRDMLGDEKYDRYNRKTIGDMACFLTYLQAVNGRQENIGNIALLVCP